MKHILFLSSWYPTRKKPFLGNFIQRQAKLLATEFNVTVLHLSSDNNLKVYETEIKEEGNFKEIIIYHPKGKNIFTKYYYLKCAFKRGLESIENVDYIQGNVLFPKGIQFSWAKKHFNCPLIYMEHSSSYNHKLKLRDKLSLRIIKPKLDKIIAVSEVLKNELIPYFNEKKITILPNHINTKLFQPVIKAEKNKTEFLHISTLDEAIKNPKGMIDACKLLIDQEIFDFHFTILSDESTKKWEKYVKDLKLESYISFKGPFEWDTIPSFYQKSDCFILFSKYETFSIVLAEAWACGISTISTPVGIAKDLPSEIGLLVTDENIYELAAAMTKIIKKETNFNPETIHAYAEKYSEKEVLSQYSAIINDIH